MYKGVVKLERNFFKSWFIEMILEFFGMIHLLFSQSLIKSQTENCEFCCIFRRFLLYDVSSSSADSCNKEYESERVAHGFSSFFLNNPRARKHSRKSSENADPGGEIFLGFGNTRLPASSSWRFYFIIRFWELMFFVPVYSQECVLEKWPSMFFPLLPEIVSDFWNPLLPKSTFSLLVKRVVLQLHL